MNDPTWQGPGNLRYGERDGEDTAVVVGAFREAGSFDGAARLLNERGVPVRLGGAVWHGTTVASIVRRVDPDEVSPSTSRGAKAGTRSFRLARLLACGTCGTLLTGSMDGKTSTVRYYCHRAKVTPHARKWVTESTVLPFVAAEVEHAALMIKRLQKGSATDEAALAKLAEKRARILDLAADGIIAKEDAQRRIAEVAEAESKLTAIRWIRRITIPPDIAADDPPKVNAYLRRVFDKAVVDMSEPALRGPSKWVPTLTFEWRDPSMHAEVLDDPDGPYVAD